MFADMSAWDLGWDAFEIAADVGGRIRFGIPDVDVTGAALQEDHDHGLRAAETARPFVLRCGLRGLLPRQKVREIQTEHSDGPGAQEFAPRGTFAGMTPA